MKQIDISTNKYPNTFALVDDSDFKALSQWKWHKNAYGYAIRYTGPKAHRTAVWMHRSIMNPPSGMDVDHINMNPLDNRRENLRICTSGQNSWNSKKPPHGRASKFKGVSWHKAREKFRAYIQVEKKYIHLGLFEKELDAAMAYNAAATKYHGEFARPNVL